MKTIEQKKEYVKQWSKHYYSIPENIEKRKKACKDWKIKNPDYFKSEKMREKSRKSALIWYYANKPRINENNRKRRLLKNHGISSQDYDNMFINQKGVCAICLNPSKKKLALDHNHTTRKVRGLLCAKCNTAIGLLGDNPSIIERAKEYLNKHDRT